MIKWNRSYLFITVSSVALVAVLVIQVRWIMQTARIKEEIFNDKANMVLSKTAEALSADKETCRSLELCVQQSDVRKIDSLFNHYMRLYNIHIDYYFEVKPDIRPFGGSGTTTADLLAPKKVEQGCFKTCVGQVPPSRNGLELKLVFPDMEQFVMAEMDVIFVTSVLLILVVLVMSWRTTVSLMREKEISEHTTDFLNNMTHELKTPLTNISLAGKMILKDGNSRQEEKVRHYSGIILEENEKLRQQVEQVLGMTALERGEMPLHKTATDVHALIAHCIKCIGVQIESRQGQVKLDLHATAFMVMADRTHLSNALCNLVDNAIKYSGDRPELSVRSFNHDQKLVIVISDKGIGIGQDYHKKVFEKFFRVPTGDVHNVKGFGLGLAYTKKIIELHNGTIALESESGAGATFTITLPHE